MSIALDNDRFRKLLRVLPGKAIEFLYDVHYHSLVRIAFNLTHDLKAAEDIVQDTLVHVWEKAESLGQYHGLSIEPYLIRVVRNKAISHYKRTRGQHEKQSLYVNGQRTTGDDHSIERDIIRREFSVEIRELIISFPRRERECLLMKMDEEMSLEEMATRLKVSRKAVERSLTSANKRLKKYWSTQK